MRDRARPTPRLSAGAALASRRGSALIEPRRLDDEPTWASCGAVDEHDARGVARPRVDEAHALGLEAPRAELAKEGGRLDGGVDEARARTTADDAPRRVEEHRQGSGLGAGERGCGRSSASRRDVRRVAHDELGAPGAGAHVPTEDVAAGAPAILLEVLRAEGGERLVELDEGHVIGRVEVEQGQADRAHSGAEIDGAPHTARSTRGRECRELERVDVHAVAGLPRRLMDDDRAVEEGVSRGRDHLGKRERTIRAMVPSSGMKPSPREAIVLEARRLGFEAVGVARADVPLDTDFARYERFLAEGMHGEMSWLASLPEARRRLDGEHVLPGARSVICLAQSYARAEADERAAPPLATGIARYARGRDYHNGLRKKLRKLSKLVRTFGAEARPLCDEEPVLERAWAARAGLGFVGKNGLLIVPGVGSLVLLGEVVTTLVLEPDPPIPERCGACTRCLDACPTSAFTAPFVLDPRLCVAYLTIEHRSAIPLELREGVGEHVFGCDDCQLACPFNARARGGHGPAVDPRFLPDPRWGSIALEDLLALDDAAFATLREGSPVARGTREGLARNAAVVLGNRGERAARPSLERAARDHDSAGVREAAAWALERIAVRDRLR